MRTTQAIAPSYAKLVPLAPANASPLPVLPDLVDRLVNATSHPDPVIAYAMAVCSAYAYGDADTLAMIMARLGIEDNRCLMVAEYVDVLFLTSTAYLVQSRDGRVVILCYRGTPPTSLITWLTDLQAEPVQITLPGPDESRQYEVHGGFYRNVRSTRYRLESALMDALAGKSVLPGAEKPDHPMEALYVTGHSLGGASASMLAAMLKLESKFAPITEKLKAVYTYGAPMIGSEGFASACDAVDCLKTRLLRYVYKNDIVPQLPPIESGGFAHFGTEYRYRPPHGPWEPSRNPRRQLHNLVEIVTTPLSVLAKQFPVTRDIRFPASIADHLPQYYLDTLKPHKVRSEYGD
jgi:hypothetical protein